MRRFILRWGINAIAIFAAVQLVPGVHMGEPIWPGVLWLALILGLLNAIVRPLLKLLTCPLIILTLGLFTLVVNTLVLELTASVGSWIGIHLAIDGFWEAFLGALVISVVSMLLSIFLRDELRQDI